MQHRTTPTETRKYTLEDFTSTDAPMLRCLELARVAAATELPLLILGETGTGKTLLARAIHGSSRRATGPFVSFNAAALSETLLDSQLFGHERGAFTGAQTRVLGKFEQAHRGTLFLDEIADMSLTAQAKILRAVEYGEFERLGSERMLVADVRLISATHLPLQRYLESDKFRRDLFYRLNGLTLTLPPLRERPRDLRALITTEIAAASRKQDKPIIGLTKEALQRLLDYDWPGNLRELNRVLHAAVALSPGEVIPSEALIIEPDVFQPTMSKRSVPVSAAAKPATNLKRVELAHIQQVLASLNGNKRQAAKALGVSRSTLDRKLAGLA